MTSEEYRRICDRLAGKAVRYAAKKVADEEVASKDVACPKCMQPAGTGCVFTNSGHDAPEGFVHNERAGAALDAQCEHWIDVFLDEHLPDIDPEALIAVTSHADAYEKSAGHPAPSLAITAVHAFQADVWDAINRMEPATGPSEKPTGVPAPRPLVTLTERVTGLELRVEVKLLGYVIDHYTGTA